MKPRRAGTLSGTAGRLLAVAALALLAACGTTPPPPEPEPPPALPQPSDFDAGRNPYPVRINGEAVPYRIFFRAIAPGGRAVIDLGETGLRVEAGAGSFQTAFAPVWTAPQRPGAYPLVFRTPENEVALVVTMYVTVPAAAAASGRIGHYEIGRYEETPYKGFHSYLPPTGFIQVTEQMVDNRVSPHFTLGQFLAKQKADFPKYILLSPDLIVKLEEVLEELNARGHRFDGFHVMSGYRTPAYNRSLGSGPYSRHVYGAAADIFPDRDGDRQIDDLNGDGVSDLADAVWLAEMVERKYASDPRTWMHGGVAAYTATQYHGPFVHIDTRGWNVRWGVGAPEKKANGGGS